MVAYSAPHVPLHAHSEFKGQSKQGLYGDVVEELDFRIGELLKTLGARSETKNTLVIFLSDNGPWVSYGIDAGTAAPFRGGKATLWEGGWRVPGLFVWPEHWPARQIDAIVSLVDVLPTLAEVIDQPMPSTYQNDGKSFNHLLRGHDDLGERTFFYFADFSGKGARSAVGSQLVAIRHESWKLVLKTSKSNRLGWLLGWKASPVALYDLGEDHGELSDVQQQNPEVVTELLSLADEKLNQICKNLAPWANNSCEKH